MRDLTIPESGSKRKLLDAAELLFAEKGFEAVSVRDITQHAKANVAAVNYHFGSRDELLALVMHRYMAPLTERRIARLDAAEQEWSGQAVPLEGIIDALVRPLATQVSGSELTERVFHRLVGRIFTQQGDGLPPLIEDQLRVVFERFRKAFAKTLPGVPAEELVWRMHFMAGGMIHMLTHREVLRSISHQASGEPSVDEVLERFISFAAKGMRDGMIAPERFVAAEPVAVIEAVEEDGADAVLEKSEILGVAQAFEADEAVESVDVAEAVELPKSPQITFDF